MSWRTWVTTLAVAVAAGVLTGIVVVAVTAYAGRPRAAETALPVPGETPSPAGPTAAPATPSPVVAGVSRVHPPAEARKHATTRDKAHRKPAEREKADRKPAEREKSARAEPAKPPKPGKADEPKKPGKHG